jgi:Protein of unknown function (DUF4089)
MPIDITLDTIRTLASTNGLTIPEERLPLVLRQYQAFLSTLERLDALDFPIEIEPATTFALPADITVTEHTRK